MSQAIIHGKISQTGSNLSSASEDLLTSSIFGPMRYLPARELLIPVLQKARNIFGKRLSISETSDPGVTFWPRYDRCEPDIEIKFNEHLIFVEAKFLSGKSGDYVAEDSVSNYEKEKAASSDQLIREFTDLKIQNRGRDYSLIYLTAHRTFPKSDIDRSLKAARLSENVLASKFKENVFWLSWLDIWDYLYNTRNTSNKYSQIISVDIRKHLERLGLKHFTGLSFDEREMVDQLDSPIFYSK